MKKRVFAIPAIAALLFAYIAASAPPRAKRKKVLFFTKSSGFEHPVVRLADDGTNVVAPILAQLGAENGFEVVHTKDGSIFTAEGLAPFDAYVFYTVGNLFAAGTDGFPPLPAGGKDALLQAIRGGKGFVGIHGATSTFHTDSDRHAQDGDAAANGKTDGNAQASGQQNADANTPTDGDAQDGPPNAQ